MQEIFYFYQIKISR